MGALFLTLSLNLELWAWATQLLFDFIPFAQLSAMKLHKKKKTLRAQEKFYTMTGLERSTLCFVRVKWEMSDCLK